MRLGAPIIGFHPAAWSENNCIVERVFQKPQLLDQDPEPLYSYRTCDFDRNIPTEIHCCPQGNPVSERQRKGCHMQSKRANQKDFVLQKVQPALLGLMDGSVSTLAPIFAAAGLTGKPANAFFVGLAASLGAGVSMGLAEALSDDGTVTGRGWSTFTRGHYRGGDSSRRYASHLSPSPIGFGHGASYCLRCGCCGITRDRFHSLSIHEWQSLEHNRSGYCRWRNRFRHRNLVRSDRRRLRRQNLRAGGGFKPHKMAPPTVGAELYLQPQNGWSLGLRSIAQCVGPSGTRQRCVTTNPYAL